MNLTSVPPNTVVPVAPVPRHSPVVQRLHSPHPAETVMVSDVEIAQSGLMSHDEKSIILEPTNVCKVCQTEL